ncbi:MAG: beta-lactamase family protein [Acidobacteriota bacterium]|nr:beta-lactamase family protein [Acidobacteriota bacterium]
MNIRYLFLIAIFLFAPAVFAQQPDPAEKRAREFVTQINNSNGTQFKEYVKANFGGDFLNLPMSAHLNFFFSVKDASRGLDVIDVAEREENRVTLRVKSRLTGESNGLSVRVDPSPPHKIVGLGMRPLPEEEREGSAKLSANEIGTELGDYIKKLANADVFSGSVLLAKGDKVIYKGAFGTANKDFGSPNKIDTKFNLGSMNKMFTAISIAKLVETGKLTIDDPLSKFVPDFPDTDSAKKIKIKHLLSHTAGLGGYFSENWQMTSRGSIRNVDDMMALAKKDEKLRFEPGTNWQYSNTGMLVLGKVIEVASGSSYFKFVDENILAPAGMKNTGCFELDKVNKNLAVGYDKVFTDDGVTFRNNIFLHVMRGGPQGGCYSTAEDLHRFATALLAGKIVGKGLVREFTTAKPDIFASAYGFGFIVSEDGNRFGHGGGFTGISANLDIFRDSGWIAIVMSNYSGASQPVSSKMRRLIALAER